MLPELQSGEGARTDSIVLGQTKAALLLATPRKRNEVAAVVATLLLLLPLPHSSFAVAATK